MQFKILKFTLNFKILSSMWEGKIRIENKVFLDSTPQQISGIWYNVAQSKATNLSEEPAASKFKILFYT
jgi:hypothetical protein